MRLGADHSLRALVAETDSQRGGRFKTHSDESRRSFKARAELFEERAGRAVGLVWFRRLPWRKRRGPPELKNG